MVIQLFIGGFKVARPLTGITLDRTTASLKTGESIDVTVTLAPSDASNKRYHVTSSNESLVAVTRKENNTWTITAAANPPAGGDATITVASAVNPTVKATLTVAVRVPVTSITVDKPTISGDTKTSTDIVFTVLPENATDKSLTVTSSDTTLATVAKKSSDGNKHTYTVTYVKGGEGVIKAVSVSDPTVTASSAFTAVQTGPSDEEKAAWTAARQKEVTAGTYKGKVPSASFEPLDGWLPFDGMGSTPAEIIAACARANDFSALFVGDYMDITVSGNQMRYEVAGIDQYYQSGVNDKHHVLMVPTSLWPTTMAFDTGNVNDYAPSDLHVWEQGAFLNALPATTRNSILEVKIPYVNYSGGFSNLACKVFSLSEIEVFGAKTYSAETVVNKGTSGKSPHTHLKSVFPDNASRVRKANNTAAWWWLRSAYSGYSSYVCDVSASGSADRFGARYTAGRACPCFTLG
ncbi:hypothetical protein CSQ85_01660 [Bifidobacterium rousetti]|uniref:DUF6273 domain-containing protein n=1 Tax=Bifidobacterium rousetti TaxID=2045439 RepID=UPI00123886C5|nr:DUF6273 domain-containing protein [Bifidobacterium rousetti]KAA8820512.1 hypothetical protein CSQ85_01660 [Bifidobacterium rousetti]